jgi:hypothetical protein
MNRTVREDSGPSLCEKNEAVRAEAIATSFESCSSPKLPIDCAVLPAGGTVPRCRLAG